MAIHIGTCMNCGTTIHSAEDETMEGALEIVKHFDLSCCYSGSTFIHIGEHNG